MKLWGRFVRWLARREMEIERVQIADKLRLQGYSGLARCVHEGRLNDMAAFEGPDRVEFKAKRRGLPWK